MGTRHSIEVVLNGELKVAQYGQWDGYPTGQGAGIADFLQNEMRMDEFVEKLSACSFLTESEIEKINTIEAKVWREKYPWLSRDAGSNVLNLIQANGPLKLLDSSDFKDDNTFCEFYYLGYPEKRVELIY